MYKQIVAHREYVTSKLTEQLSEHERRKLLKYHIRRVRDFQHERLIHLLVTFFFAALLICSILIWLTVQLATLFWLMGALVALLLVLELAYIRHYYQLENGVQSLYELTEQLGKE